MINGNKVQIYLISLLCLSVNTYAHDTTHIHPLITAEIARLIKNTDGTGAYFELYEPEPTQDPANPADQLLYWGTDFDPVGIATTTKPLQEYLGNDETEPYLNGLLSGYSPIAKNVITGVVYEDVPFTKVLDHFYHAEDESALTNKQDTHKK